MDWFLKLIKLLPIFSAVFFLTSCSKTDQEQIEFAFSAYCDAISEGNPDRAIQYIDDRTFLAYETLLELALTADSTALSKASVSDQIGVITLRMNFSKTELPHLSGEELFQFFNGEKYIIPDQFEDCSLTEIRINDKHATGKAVQDNVKTNYTYQFYKVNNDWKVDVSSAWHYWEDLRPKSLTALEYIYSCVKHNEGRIPQNKIWHWVN